MNKKWIYRKKNEKLYLDLINSYDQNDFVATMLSSRSFVTEENFSDFLDPKIKNLMPDPFSLKDMLVATEFIKQAIEKNQKIALFADYDVDGATSAAIMNRFFKLLNIDTIVYIPDRVKEGYGPNEKALLDLHRDGVSVVITLDCGTVAFDSLAKAAKIGLNVVVIDHHIGTKDKPESIAVINPNRKDETTDLTYLCGAGVCFMFCAGMLKVLNRQDLARRLFDLLDLVALGTVCDVVPLKGLNRAFVKSGLKIADKRGNIGLNALILESEIKNNNLSTFDFGFLIGPMINAGGRIGDSNKGATLLSTKDFDLAKGIASELKNLNIKRREMESEIIEMVVEEIQKKSYENSSFIFTYNENWHEGIIGIIASRVKDRFFKLAIIGSVVKDENHSLIKASCRSIPGINIGSIITECVARNILVKGGGHSMAAGFVIDLKMIDDFIDFVDKKISKLLIENIIEVDYGLSLSGITSDLCDKIELLAPFGPENEEPLFMIQNVIIISFKIIKDSHISILFKCPETSIVQNAISFRSYNTELGNIIISSKGKSVDFICKINFQMYLGQKRPNVIIIDIVAK